MYMKRNLDKYNIFHNEKISNNCGKSQTMRKFGKLEQLNCYVQMQVLRNVTAQGYGIKLICQVFNADSSARTQPGLGIRPFYEDHGDLQVEIVQRQ